MHPNIDPHEITASLGITPKWSRRAGEPRQTPKWKPLGELNEISFWTSELDSGRWPERRLRDALKDVLLRLEQHRPFLHRLRAEKGSAELFIGWFFDGQSGDILSHEVLTLAGDLQIDLSLDIYH
jgi:hypothetical protein